MRFAALPLILLLASGAARSDDLWLQAASAKSTVASQQFGLTRTFNSDSPVSFETGLSHFNGSGASWTLAKLGMSGRISKSFILGGRLDLGPGHSDGEEISYHKAALTGTWLISPAWSLQIGDTYINISDSIGHVYSSSISRSFGSGVSLTLEHTGSTGGNIDTKQLGFKFRWQKAVPVFGGVYSGETRNPIILNEVGNGFSEVALDLRQAYAGIELPIGDFSVLAVFDYLRLDQTIRRELSVAVRIPLGGRRATR
ncbi:MAG: hypothetical protein HKN77_07070 [Woeseiaceae bacterium]|nr:hypothetical protein [Woeseiaceae bacterium]